MNELSVVARTIAGLGERPGDLLGAHCIPAEVARVGRDVKKWKHVTDDEVEG